MSGQGTQAAEEVVIVGGGPVGLWTAIQLKKRMPAVHVTVYERHEVYQRSHVLRLDHWSLLLYSHSRRQPSEQAFYRDVTGKSVGRVRLTFANSVYIRTNDLEAALRAYATREGVQLVHLRIENVAQAEALHPLCTVFLAADGARSPLRRELLGSQDMLLRNLQHVVELKFEEAGEPRRFDIRQTWRFNQQLQFLGSDHVGRKKGDTTPVTFRLLLDKDTYRALPEMSFKVPCPLDAPALPATIRSNVRSYLQFRRTELGTAPIEASCRLSKLPLNMYVAKRFSVLRAPDKAWFLVGDAAMGVPYFRALNCGMLLGSRLAMLIGRNGGLDHARLPRLVDRFERRRMLHVCVELLIARTKDSLFNAVKWLRQRFATSPT